MFNRFVVLFGTLLSSFAFSQSAPPTCPDGIGAQKGEAPKVIAQFKDGMKLIVCGSEEVEKAAGPFKLMSEFDVYSVNADGLRSASLKKAGAGDHFRISALSSGLAFQGLLWVGGHWIPSFQSTLTCENNKCTMSKETCVYEAAKPASTQSLVEIRGYVRGKYRKKIVPDELVTALGELALSGNKNAQNFFLKKPVKVRLDAASAEGFESFAETLTALKKAKCL